MLARRLVVVLALVVLLVPVALAIDPVYTKVTQNTNPAGATNSVAFSYDGRYLATTTTGQLAVYNLTSGTPTKATGPSSQPGSIAYDVHWNPAGTLIAVAQITASPAVQLYSFDGTTVTRCTDPSGIGANNYASKVSWSSDGQFLSAAYQTFTTSLSPWFRTWYVNGCTTQALADPTGPGADVTDVEWQPNAGGTLVAMTDSSANRVDVYQVSGSGASATLTKLTAPAGVTGASYVRWSPDGAHFAVDNSGTGVHLLIYDVSGTTFTSVTIGGTQSWCSGNNCAVQTLAWSPDSSTLMATGAGTGATPWVYAVYRTTTTYTYAAAPASTPGGNSYGGVWNPDGSGFFFGRIASPFMNTYSWNAGTHVMTKLGDPASLPSGAVQQCGAQCEPVAWSPTRSFVALTDQSSPFLTVYSTGISGAPQNVTATPGVQQVTVAWSAVSGATSYRVYRSTSAGVSCSGSPVATPSGTSATDTGLVGGTTYYYRVSSVNGLGEGACSSEVSAIPTGSPSAPSAQGVYVPCSTFALNWTLPTGSPDGYNVTRTSPLGGNRSFLVGPLGDATLRLYNDSFPPFHSTFSYTVAAHNVVGWGPSSAPVNFTPSNLSSVGSCGLIWGGDQAVLAAQAGVSVDALGILISIVLVVIGAGLGFAITGRGVGATGGSAVGLLLSLGFQLIPLWGSFLLLVVLAGGYLVMAGGLKSSGGRRRAR